MWKTYSTLCDISSLVCISHMTVAVPIVEASNNQVDAGHLLDVHLHTDTAPLRGKAATAAVGHHQTRHEFVWCAKLSCVGLTDTWEDRGSLKDGTSWASHHENIMSDDLTLWQNDKAPKRQNSFRRGNETRWCLGCDRQKQHGRVTVSAQSLVDTIEML